LKKREHTWLKFAFCIKKRWMSSAERREKMQPFPRHCPAETSHDATKAAIRRISLGSVSSGA